MKQFEINYPTGATPLSPEERDGLIPDYISTHGELNELEQKNIEVAILWFKRRRKASVLDPFFIFELHKQMFNKVWRWAGRSRTSDKNIGVDWRQITLQMEHLIEDVKYWIEHNTYSWDEIGIRFHHRLVQIHIFPNGNGRHARLLTDLLLESNGQDPFTWGMNSSSTPLETESDRRKDYIEALHAADQRSYDLLLKFVRS